MSFFAAHTVTVTERNIGSVAQIVRWLIADPRHLDAFRMVNFQTEADVGRTSIRTAIGQLLDYRRFEEPDWQLGVLLPRPPDDDLVHLILSLPASCAWPHADGFDIRQPGPGRP